jgi:hypothetical protein
VYIYDTLKGIGGATKVEKILKKLSCEIINDYSEAKINANVVIIEHRNYWSNVFPNSQLVDRNEFVRLFLEIEQSDKSTDLIDEKDKIIELLQNDPVLAVGLIGDSMILPEYIPYLLYNKDIKQVEEFMNRRGIRRGNFRPSHLIDDFCSFISTRLKSQLLVPTEQLLTFLNFLLNEYSKNNK